ncbi:glycosyltransferase [Laspinema sp. A4]|uniref:glycosyltransferase family 2 protein n=1 Tax=Laspinema sp. D2d TaxID=2953686 RepID=UPI0021BABF09|nr:glycosyltransferase family 2 protein [Laspinema sp. D2d]MCT7983621.1 glycosyltransferase [Laspinema sp. D2d]
MIKASVSVIIPCYRCADTISRCVESVVNQTIPPKEIILVDDGSKDETLSVILKLQETYGKDWIKVVALKENSGVSVARNTGWDLASQDYIAFLDADNAWHPEKIDIQYNWMLENSQALLSGHTIPVCSSYENFLSSITVSLKGQLTYTQIKPQKLLLSNPFETSSIMLNRDIKYRFDPHKRYSEDYFLWQEICLDGSVCFLLNVQLSYIFNSFGTAGLTSRLFKMRLEDFNNYWQLWRKNRITVTTMILLIMFSVIKFTLLLILRPEIYSFLKHKKNVFNKFRNSYIFI